jgi:hypothetical protein
VGRRIATLGAVAVAVVAILLTGRLLRPDRPESRPENREVTPPVDDGPAAAAPAAPSSSPTSEARGPVENGLRVAGILRTHDGKPAAKLLVTLEHEGMLAEDLTVRTDAEGRFAFRDLPAGTCELTANWSAIWTVKAGAESLRLRLPAPPAPSRPRKRYGQLEVNGFYRGRAVAGFLDLLEPDGRILKPGIPSNLFEAETQAILRDEGSTPHFHEHIEVPDRSRRLLVSVWAMNGLCTASPAVVEIRADETTRVNLELVPGRVIDTLVVDPRGSPVRRATVVASSGPGAPPVHRRTWTDPDGRVAVPVLPAGRYRLRAESKGWLPAEKEIVVREKGDTSVRLQLAEGGRIRVVVRDARGRPVPGALVKVIRDGKPLLPNLGPYKREYAELKEKGTRDTWTAFYRRGGVLQGDALDLGRDDDAHLDQVAVLVGQGVVAEVGPLDSSTFWRRSSRRGRSSRRSA